jgi:hypothetical protein
MSSQETPAPGHSNPRSSRLWRHPKQVVVQKVPEEIHDSTRVDRLATLLSEALARRLGQGQPVELPHAPPNRLTIP